MEDTFFLQLEDAAVRELLTRTALRDAALVTVGPSLHMENCNEAAARMTGLRPMERLDQMLSEAAVGAVRGCIASGSPRTVCEELDGVDYRLEPEVTSVQLQAKDLLLLCSDGLTNMVPVEQMEQLLAQGPFYDLPDRLVDAANENGGSDNITALLLAVEPTEVHHG